MRWLWALGAGLVGAGVTVGVLARRDTQRLRLRAVALRTSFEAGGTGLEQALLSKGTSLQDELRWEAERLTRSLAEAEAQRVLGTTYGLTEERVANLQRVGERFARFIP